MLPLREEETGGILIGKRCSPDELDDDGILEVEEVMMPVIGAGPEVLGIEGCTEAVGTFSGIPCPGSGGRSNEPEAVGRVGAALDVELDVLGTLFAEDFGIVPELLVNKGVACDLGCCSGSGGIEPLLLIEVLEIVGAVDVGSGGKSSNPPPAVDPRRGRLATGSKIINVSYSYTVE